MVDSGESVPPIGSLNMKSYSETFQDLVFFKEKMIV